MREDRRDPPPAPWRPQTARRRPPARAIRRRGNGPGRNKPRRVHAARGRPLSRGRWCRWLRARKRATAHRPSTRAAWVRVAEAKLHGGVIPIQVDQKRHLRQADVERGGKRWPASSRHRFGLYKCSLCRLKCYPAVLGASLRLGYNLPPERTEFAKRPEASFNQLEASPESRHSCCRTFDPAAVWSGNIGGCFSFRFRQRNCESSQNDDLGLRYPIAAHAVKTKAPARG